MTSALQYLAARRRVRLGRVATANRRYETATTTREQSRWRKEAARNARKAELLGAEILSLCDQDKV
jgi:hypothetical protein